MPWFIAVLLSVAALGLVVKAVLDRKARYDEPTNDWDGCGFRSKSNSIPVQVEHRNAASRTPQRSKANTVTVASRTLFGL